MKLKARYFLHLRFREKLPAGRELTRPGLSGKARVCLLAAALLLAGAAPAPAKAGNEEEPGIIESWRLSRLAGRADRLFNEGKYERARAEYMRGQELAGEDSSAAQRLHFNIGATLYKQGNYDEAEKEFKKALDSPDLDLREMAYYNLGNIYFKKGLQAQDVSLLEKAVQQYQKALELNPDDQEAKFNIEVVRRHLRMKKEQPPPQGPSCPNPKTGPKQEQTKHQQKQQGQGKGQQEKKPGEKEKPAPKEKEPQEAEKTPKPSPAGGGTAEPAQTRQKPGQVKPQGSMRKEGELSKEEAERLLNALKESEKDALKEFLQYYSGQRLNKEKDW